MTHEKQTDVKKEDHDHKDEAPENLDPESAESGQEGPGAEPSGGEQPANGTELTLEQQLAQTRETLLRKAADFENYKKRTEAEIQTIIRLANESLILSILPIVDDLDRSLKLGNAADDVASFHKGVELIQQKLRKILESHGVTPLETTGKPFDVHYHDAMMQVPKGDVEPNTVLEEVEKGYSMNGKVIRHAKVIVSAPPDDSADAADGKDGAA